MPGKADEACGVGCAVMEEQPELETGVAGTSAGVFVGVEVAVADAAGEEQDVSSSRKKNKIMESRNIFVRMRTSLYHVIANALCELAKYARTTYARNNFEFIVPLLFANH